MNGNFPATIFQDFTVEPGSTVNISFAHRGRQGNDTVGVEIGPVGGPYVNLGSFTDGNTAWVLQNVSYIIPLTTGTDYSLRFVSVSSAGGSASVGNYLDAVSITTVQCSSAPTTGTVSLLPNVTLTLTTSNQNQSVCINTPIAPILYTTVNATDVTVSGLPTGVSGVFNAGEFTISGTPSETGTFNYTVTTVGGCTVETATGTLVVNPDSTLVLSNGSDIQNLCINTAISAIEYTSTAASDVTVTGLPNGVTGTFNAGVLTISGTPTESGVFNYSVTTVSTCATVTLNGTITVNPDVTLTLTSANENQTVCINTPIASIVYSSTNTTDVTVVGLPNGVTGTYNSGVFTITGSPTESGTFNYTVSTVGTCGNASLTGTIIVNPNVTLSLSSGNNAQNLCINTAITNIVYQSGNGATGINVTGLPAGVSSSLVGDLLTISGTPTAAGTFTYTVTTTGGCSTASLTGTIVVNNLVTPTFNFGTSLVLCPGIVPPVLPGTSENSITGTWSPSTINTVTSGTYTFTPDANQCATTTTLTVSIQSAFNFIVDGDCFATSFILFADPIDNGYDEDTASYSWVLNGNVVSTDPEFNVTAYVNSTSVVEELPLVFTLTITRADGCSNTNSFTVTRIYCDIQNGISPNGDGKNEFFDLATFNVRTLSIFNRYGTKVYIKGNYTVEWIGQSDAGEELPDGTYYYVIEFNDNQDAKTGWIYINRQKR
jgi:gliding motility-associated-like protein